ncbi:unnamed protein product [Prorocentrum cordatum]|uniref:Protein kinase domain-containing protein n=1 Tax=Prorocentrum cordatum TaxID=2364126 RepID=A0ABN9VDU7_9DINO|nr:unnamed protein product [Polarella glacialis]
MLAVPANTHRSRRRSRSPSLCQISLTRDPVELPEPLSLEYENVGQDPLGEGAFAIVKLVRHRTTHEQFALKCIDKYQLNIRGMAAQMEQEVLIHQALDHPNILKLVRVVDAKDYLFMLLEFCGGGTLRDHLDDAPGRRLPEPEAAKHFEQVVRGTECMHRHQCIHRDLKLENVLFTSAGVVKICDFGWSTQVQMKRQQKTKCGTMAHWAPEQWDNGPQDPAEGARHRVVERRVIPTLGQRRRWLRQQWWTPLAQGDGPDLSKDVSQQLMTLSEKAGDTRNVARHKQMFEDMNGFTAIPERLSCKFRSFADAPASQYPATAALKWLDHRSRQPFVKFPRASSKRPQRSEAAGRRDLPLSEMRLAPTSPRAPGAQPWPQLLHPISNVQLRRQTFCPWKQKFTGNRLVEVVTMSGKDSRDGRWNISTQEGDAPTSQDLASVVDSERHWLWERPASQAEREELVGEGLIQVVSCIQGARQAQKHVAESLREWGRKAHKTAVPVPVHTAAAEDGAIGGRGAGEIQRAWSPAAAPKIDLGAPAIFSVESVILTPGGEAYIEDLQPLADVEEERRGPAAPPPPPSGVGGGGILSAVEDRGAPEPQRPAPLAAPEEAVEERARGAATPRGSGRRARAPAAPAAPESRQVAADAGLGIATGDELLDAPDVPGLAGRAPKILPSASRERQRLQREVATKMQLVEFKDRLAPGDGAGVEKIRRDVEAARQMGEAQGEANAARKGGA